MPAPLMEPAFEYCFELRCLVDEAIPLGGAEPGEGLHFARVSGGDFDGPRLRGRVLNSGGDWWTARGLTVELDARYVIEAEVTGGTAGVEVVNRGVWRTDEASYARLLAGEDVDERGSTTAPRSGSARSTPSSDGSASRSSSATRAPRPDRSSSASSAWSDPGRAPPSAPSSQHTSRPAIRPASRMERP